MVFACLLGFVVGLVWFGVFVWSFVFVFCCSVWFGEWDLFLRQGLIPLLARDSEGSTCWGQRCAPKHLWSFVFGRKDWTL